jgi:hypothetical protein
MSDSFLNFDGVHVYAVPAIGAELRTPDDAVDLISAASEYRATWIAVPVDRLGDDFFELRTRIAGDMTQKFATYGAKVVIVGDISRRIAASKALAAFVAESNRGQKLWFVESFPELRNRLSESRAS